MGLWVPLNPGCWELSPPSHAFRSLVPITQGSPTSRPLWTSYWSRPARNLATWQEVSLNVMGLNHPETIPLCPSPWENCLPWNRSLVPKRLGSLLQPTDADHS